MGEGGALWDNGVDFTTSGPEWGAVSLCSACANLIPGVGGGLGSQGETGKGRLPSGAARHSRIHLLRPFPKYGLAGEKEWLRGLTSVGNRVNQGSLLRDFSEPLYSGPCLCLGSLD